MRKCFGIIQRWIRKQIRFIESSRLTTTKTLLWRYLNVMDVGWTFKQRCVPTGFKLPRVQFIGTQHIEIRSKIFEYRWAIPGNPTRHINNLYILRKIRLSVFINFHNSMLQKND